MPLLERAGERTSRAERMGYYFQKYSYAHKENEEDLYCHKALQNEIDHVSAQKY